MSYELIQKASESLLDKLGYSLQELVPATKSDVLAWLNAPDKFSTVKSGAAAEDDFTLAGSGSIKDVGDDYTMNGLLSSPEPDYTNEIVLPSAFADTFARYQKNPTYLFMHDQRTPIGIVKNPSITEEGVYLEGITLNSALAFVTDIVWPNVKFGAMRQQSAGFIKHAVAFTKDKKYMVHTKSTLIEGSLVTIACNHTCDIDTIKAVRGIQELEASLTDGKVLTLSDLFVAHSKGLIQLPSEYKTSKAVDGFREILQPVFQAKSSEATLTDEAPGKIAVMVHESTKSHYDPARVSMLSETVGDKVCASKRLDVTAEFFCGAVPLFDSLTGEQQKSLLAAFDAAYAVEGKSAITVKRPGGIGALEAKAVVGEANVKAADLVFPDNLVELAQAVKAYTDAADVLVKFAEANPGALVAPEVHTASKSVYVYYNISGYVHDAADVAVATAIMQAAVTAESEEENDSVISLASASEGGAAANTGAKAAGDEESEGTSVEVTPAVATAVETKAVQTVDAGIFAQHLGDIRQAVGAANTQGSN